MHVQNRSPAAQDVYLSFCLQTLYGTYNYTGCANGAVSSSEVVDIALPASLSIKARRLQNDHLTVKAVQVPGANRLARMVFYASASSGDVAREEPLNSAANYNTDIEFKIKEPGDHRVAFVIAPGASKRSVEIKFDVLIRVRYNSTYLEFSSVFTRFVVTTNAGQDGVQPHDLFGALRSSDLVPRVLAALHAEGARVAINVGALERIDFSVGSQAGRVIEKRRPLDLKFPDWQCSFLLPSAGWFRTSFYRDREKWAFVSFDVHVVDQARKRQPLTSVASAADPVPGGAATISAPEVYSSFCLVTQYKTFDYTLCANGRAARAPDLDDVHAVPQSDGERPFRYKEAITVRVAQRPGANRIAHLTVYAGSSDRVMHDVQLNSVADYDTMYWFWVDEAGDHRALVVVAPGASRGSAEARFEFRIRTRFNSTYRDFSSVFTKFLVFANAKQAGESKTNLFDALRFVHAAPCVRATLLPDGARVLVRFETRERIDVSVSLRSDSKHMIVQRSWSAAGNGVYSERSFLFAHTGLYRVFLYRQGEPGAFIVFDVRVVAPALACEPFVRFLVA